MKLKTHNIFTTGILTVIGSFFTNPLTSLISASLLSLMVNQIIDTLGHKRVYKSKISGLPLKRIGGRKRKKDNDDGSYLVRTPLTHTITRSVFWGLIPAVILFLLFGSLDKLPALHLNGYQPYWILLQGIFAGPLHMCLDIITEGGIFRRKNNKFVRFAVAHIAYDDLFWNVFFQFAGLGFVFLIFYSRGLLGGHYGRII